MAYDPVGSFTPTADGAARNDPSRGGGRGGAAPPAGDGTDVDTGGGTPGGGVYPGGDWTPPRGMDPYNASATWQSGSSSQQQNQSGTSVGNTVQDQLNNNIYDPVSLALRGQGAEALQQILATGQLPGNFGMSKQAFDALNSAFERNIAPGMAAQFGAGSPAIASQEALMNEQLAAQLSQQQWANFSNIFDEVANFAYTPTGQQSTSNVNSNTSQEQTTDTTGTWQTNNTMAGALASSLLTAMGKGGNII